MGQHAKTLLYWSFYTGIKVTKSHKRGSTHSTADIEAKGCKNVREITPKGVLKQELKVIPTFVSLQARHKLTKPPSAVPHDSNHNTKFYHHIIHLTHLLCNIRANFSPDCSSWSSPWRLRLSALRFSPRTLLILAENPSLSSHTHTHLRSGSTGSAFWITIGPERRQSPRQTNQNEGGLFFFWRRGVFILDPKRDIRSAVMAAELDLHCWFCICLLIPDPNPFTWTGRQGEEETNCSIYTLNRGSNCSGLEWSKFR